MASNDTVGVGAAALTCTTTVWASDPPGPTQVRVKLVVPESAATISLPLVVRAPLQPPDALQVSALLEDQLSDVDSPAATSAGDAASDTVGGVSWTWTVTVTVCDAVPPEPAHVNVKLVVAPSAGVEVVPLVARLPVHPPELVHEVEFVAAQLRVVV